MNTTPKSPTPSRRLRRRGKDARFKYDIAVFGLGRPGLRTALAYHTGGSRVLAVDTSADRLMSIGAGAVDLVSSDQERLRTAVTDDRFQLTARPACLSQSRAVIVCVPTPVDAHFVPSPTALQSACATAVDHAVAGQLLMLTSTTYVGCTDDLLVKPLVQRGFRIGEDIFVAFTAELLDPGIENVAQVTVPRVVGGATVACGKRAVDTLSGYAQWIHCVPSLATAETAKLLEHTFRTVNAPTANVVTDDWQAPEIKVTRPSSSNIPVSVPGQPATRSVPT